jgi:hypothetical protein
VDAEYGSEWGGWHSVDSNGPHGVGLWRFISRGWQLFSSCTRFDPGNKSNIRFWDDVWCGESTLKEALPSLYNIAFAKEASNANNLDFIGGSRQWNISFIRLAHDWELEVLASSYSLLYSFRMHREGEDKIWWILSRKGKFDVRSYYDTLVRKEASPFPWKSIWRTKAPSRVVFFAWTMVLGQILTIDNLRRRNLIVINRCSLCKSGEENVDHLFLHYDFARSLWNAVFSRFGLSWVMPSKVVGLFACWWSGGRSRSTVVWKMVLLCIVWYLWLERNERCFEDSERTLEELTAFFFYLLYTWTAAWLAPFVISYLDFLSLFSSS